VSKSEAQAAAEKATKAMHQAEAAFQGAVHRVEEMIQIGRRELANVREAAKDALARLLASAQRGAQVAAGEAQAMARKVSPAAQGRKARAGVKSATKKATATVTARKKPGGRARAAKRGRKG
jgi:hypothetical protein